MKRQAPENVQDLSEEERKLYDRQIRLWGLDAQKRLNKFQVCIAGLTGLGAETAKNVILAGVARIDLVDHKAITQDDLRSQFMVTPSDLGKNRASSSLNYAKRLNPMVKVSAVEEDILSKDADYLKQFDMLVVCDMIPVQKIVELDELCRSLNVKLSVGHVVGGFGFFLNDFLQFDYVGQTVVHLKDGKKVKSEARIENFQPLKRIFDSKFVNKKKGAALTKRTHRAVFQLFLFLKYYDEKVDETPTSADLQKLIPSVSEALEAPEDRFGAGYLDDVLSGEVGPVAAIVGGILGQEVIKVASQNADPMNNAFIFDGDSCAGMVERLM